MTPETITVGEFILVDLNNSLAFDEGDLIIPPELSEWGEWSVACTPVDRFGSEEAACRESLAAVKKKIKPGQHAKFRKKLESRGIDLNALKFGAQDEFLANMAYARQALGQGSLKEGLVAWERMNSLKEEGGSSFDPYRVLSAGLKSYLGSAGEKKKRLLGIEAQNHLNEMLATVVRHFAQDAPESIGRPDSRVKRELTDLKKIAASFHEAGLAIQSQAIDGLHRQVVSGRRRDARKPLSE